MNARQRRAARRVCVHVKSAKAKRCGQKCVQKGKCFDGDEVVNDLLSALSSRKPSLPPCSCPACPFFFVCTCLPTKRFDN